MNNNNFKYLVDSFADTKVIRYKVPGFEELSLKQKTYIYYLSEAALSGRDIFFQQNYKYALYIRKCLENIIKTYQGDKENDSYNEFLIYTKRIFISNSIEHHYSTDKILPKCSKDYFEELINNSDTAGFIFLENQNFSEFKEWIIKIIYDYKINSDDLIVRSSTNFYENITTNEAKDYYDKLEKINENESEPISYGLNSKLIKKDGKIVEETYKINGLYSKAISKIVENLEKAINYAENENQIKYTKKLIEYYKSGDLKIWDDYSILWLKENDGLVDYINGFLEVYKDPIGIKGSWEALVNIKNIEETKITEIIANNANWFEENSPIDEEFKKNKVVGISAKVIDAVMLGGECYPSAPIGINLPNSNWIRDKHGSKSVSISNLVEAVDNANLELPKSVVGEFVYDQDSLEKNKSLIIIGSKTHTHLHECLGHGSGKVNPGVTDSSLKEYYAPLEEARADLFALYYIADDKMIELGIISSKDVAKVYYESYIRNGLQTQLTRVELGKDIVQAHMKARKLISEIAYEKGKKDNVIEKIIKNEKTYFVVNDYLKLRDIFAEILKEIQKIKSVGNYKECKRLIDTYATKVDYELHKEVLDRYKKLELKPWTAYINPVLIPVFKNNEVVDIKINYPDDFLKQQLEYGDKYSFL